MVSIALLFLLPSYASQTSGKLHHFTYIKHLFPPSCTDGVIQTETEKIVSLVCILTGTVDNKELEWRRNGAVIKLDDGNKENRSSVCINPVIYKDEGAKFTCQLKSNSSHSASVTLNVTWFPPILSLTPFPNLISTLPFVSLTCRVQSNPAGQYVWFHNDSEVYSGPQLIITKILRLHTGGYTCVGQNSYLNTQSRKTITLTVYCKWDFKIQTIPLSVLHPCRLLDPNMS
uniref:Ig-like domain-containing protein n=1 Tax=Xiphophorus couchianus TaxID=32473 RepID=A0A3B5MHS8_9TELE